MDLGRNANGVCSVALRKCWLGSEDADKNRGLWSDNAARELTPKWWVSLLRVEPGCKTALQAGKAQFRHQRGLPGSKGIGFSLSDWNHGKRWRKTFFPV